MSSSRSDKDKRSPIRSLAKTRAKAKARAARAATGDVPLTPTERQAIDARAIRFLRGLGHELQPVVQIGKEGVTAGVVAATSAALLAHELIKVKILAECPEDRHEAAAHVAEECKAALAQVLGRTALLYRRHPKKPRIALPA